MQHLAAAAAPPSLPRHETLNFPPAVLAGHADRYGLISEGYGKDGKANED